MGLKGLGWAITLWCVFKGTECVCILREEEEMKTYSIHKERRRHKYILDTYYKKY